MTFPLVRPRIIAFLTEHGPMDSQAIADNCHCTRRHTQLVIRQLREEGLVHIARWERYGDGASGTMIPRYAYGAGDDAKKPPRTSNNEVQRNRRERLRTQYGRSIAYRILSSRNADGIDQVVLEGRTVFQRGKPRNPGGRYGIRQEA